MPEIEHKNISHARIIRSSSNHQESYYKKIQRQVFEILKKSSEEAIEFLMKLDKDFVVIVLSIEHFKPVKWAMLNNEIKAFEVMVDLLDYEQRSKMLNDDGVCSSFDTFVICQEIKKSYDCNSFINGVKIFLQIDAEGC